MDVLIVAGPNGAGKTTFAREYVEEHPRPFLSADALAARLHPDDPTSARIPAGRLFFKELEALITQRAPFVVESTLSGLGYARVLERLRRLGYVSTITFITLETPEACVRRVQERVRKGGHDVPEADIVRRFYRSKHNFWNVYRHQVDRWHLYVNQDEDFHLVAAGASGHTAINDQRRYEKFLLDVRDAST